MVYISLFFLSLFLQLHQIERLKVRLRVMQFIGNFEEDMAIMVPVSYGRRRRREGEREGREMEREREGGERERERGLNTLPSYGGRN